LELDVLDEANIKMPPSTKWDSSIQKITDDMLVWVIIFLTFT
jgi:hypothetical protein